MIVNNSLALMDRNSVAKWLNSNSLESYGFEVMNIGYSIIPEGGTDTDDYVMAKSINKIIGDLYFRQLECEVSTLIAKSIDTLK